MARDRDDQLDTTEQGFSLDEILAEFSSSHQGGGDTVPREKTSPRPDRTQPEQRPGPERAKPRPDPAGAARHSKKGEGRQKVIHFPGDRDEEKEDESSREEGPPSESLWSKLLKKADEYASHMFEQEEPDPESKRAEQFLPGVDEERPRLLRPKPARARRVRTWPDTPPQELAARYGRGLGFLRVRRLLLFLLALPLLYLTLVPSLGLPLPGLLSQHWLQIWICAGVQMLAILLSLDLLASGLTRLGGETLIALATFAVLADACSMNSLGDREGSLPYCLVSVLAMGFGLWGMYLKKLGLRTACRTAAAAKSPDAVTLDENKWDGRPAFTKWTSDGAGFGSQIQSEDGAQRLLRPVSGVLILACVLFSLISSVSRGKPELLPWCLSATLSAAASFSSLLIFSLPFSGLTRRLAGAGAALAGWEGIRRQAKGAGILLTDTDLFPPGSVKLNGIKVFHDQPLNKVVSVTATLIRDMGSGLERPFHELLRSQGAVYRRSSELRCYEGGACAVIRDEQILVGTAAFMHLMEVSLPQGLNVKNAVFCAIDGELAGIFALNYSLHATVRPALSALISNRIAPILATRDFNLIPAMLQQRFKLPAEKMEFPEQKRRRQLSASRQRHDLPLVCILCREGIGPLADAVVGAKRLTLATRISSALSAAGSTAGVLLTFYLTFQAAFASLSVPNLLVFQLMWLVPVLLVSGWVNRY